MPPRFTDLKALFLNTSLTPTARGISHTERLMKNSAEIMRRNGASVDMIRVADHDIAFGIQPDMR